MELHTYIYYIFYVPVVVVPIWDGYLSFMRHPTVIYRTFGPFQSHMNSDCMHGDLCALVGVTVYVT